ncbi:hypothetical protein [Sphingomonas sp. 3P27F8]|uniref:hypothetical protein n=1 Tax=Sphingomonas sp. 3P27F8 TaxID=2502213 RepID=UPI001485A84F|nr:hypothetical protein [Sphingomonas sp. 3P27F8]
MSRQMHQVGRVRLLGRGVIMMIPIDADDMRGIMNVRNSVMPGGKRQHPEQRQNRRERKKAHAGTGPHRSAQSDRRCRHVVTGIANTAGPQARRMVPIMAGQTKIIGGASADEVRR